VRVVSEQARQKGDDYEEEFEEHPEGSRSKLQER
jgi:hypothetical protein